MSLRGYYSDLALAAQGLKEWGEHQPGVQVLALVAAGSLEHLPLLQAECKGIEVAGAVFPELISDGQFMPKGALLVTLPAGSRFFLRSSTTAEADAEALEEYFAPHLNPQGGDGLFLIPDATVRHGSSLLAELHLRLSDSVNYAGAGAGSASFEPGKHLFHRDRCHENGILAILVPGMPSPLLHHGFRVGSEDRIATAAEGNRVVRIDWKPAFEVYQDMVQAQYGHEVTRDNFF